MKKLILLTLLIGGTSVFSQSKTDLIKHYEAYYKQMRLHGDVQGAINGLTHLDVLQPSQAKKDTLAYLYLSEGKNMQALNVIGIEKNVSDSDIAVEVKALALQAVNQPKRALEHFEVMFTRKPSVLLAYEMADIKLQLNDLAGAKKNIEYGLANAKDDQMRAFYETQQPYQVPVKAALLYLKGIVTLSEDRTANIDAVIGLLDQALQVAPNFNMANVTKEALVAQKTTKE
jgi:tetratricopeptide (TPR) repeat protein